VSQSRGVFWETALFFIFCAHTTRGFPHLSVYVLFSFCGALSDGGKVIAYVLSCQA
jgi:hypothetical protein